MKIILLAIRSLTHFRLYTLINIVGLALSLACVIIISRYVYSELMTDRFNENLEQLYTITIEKKKKAGEIHFSAAENPNHEKSFNDILEHPAVASTSLTRLNKEYSCWYQEKEFPALILTADSNFFQLIKYPLITETNTLLKPEEAFITQAFAQKIFGKEPAIGKQLHLSFDKEVTIAGIIGQPATPSSLEFDLVVSEQLLDSWKRMGNHLVKLHPNTDYREVNRQYSKFMYMNYGQDSVRHQLYPLADVYFSKHIENFFFRTGNYTYIWILSLVALLILLVGLFNFINIYSVVILRRGREFGMKKVFGANARMMFGQLFVENLLMAGIALFLGWMFVEITAPLVRNQMGINPVVNNLFDISFSVGILLILPLIASLIPFIRYNYAAPIVSLRSVGKEGEANVSRRIFLVTQYIITFSLIICSLFFIKQLLFMLHADPGIRTKDIIQTQFLREGASYNEKTKQTIDEIKQQMDACPLFEHWTYGGTPVGMGQTFRFKLPDGELKDFTFSFVSREWFELFGIQLTEGMLAESSSFETNGYDLYISESGKKLLGITDITQVQIQPERRLWTTSFEDYNSNPPFRILGTFKDFNINHLANKSNPIILLPGGHWPISPLTASIVPGRKQEAIQFLKKLHHDTVGGSFEYTFLEDQYNMLYRKDNQIALIYSVFALIAILISSLGLFSLSLFDVQQRYREIAIRKVNGATTSVVMQMLLQKYYQLLAIAFLVAIPISWLAIIKYLENFANKASVSWWIFAISLLLTTGISLLTLIWQIRKAAQTNPAKAIKSE